MLENIINAYENRLREAMIRSDIEELNQLLADDLKFVGHFGQVITKEDDIRSHQSRDFKMESIVINSQDIYMIDAAVITISDVQLGISIGDQNILDHLIYTRVWQKINNDWKVIRGQATQVK
ncbi:MULTISPECIES: nuclear transport factor 2 family protein [unclassified Enterococcus]|uniref:nuclear transport factor 2 family protein n=1 Tax=unclassified Enterococcus TaxID=2608891 RepID=UPI00155621DB|nr:MULTISPECIES: nuclear transport factor 2 family protein [unclassified Enterococcus]MBS7576020.1 nuclear transport factor 2 family protein [Enterococcus sp. MMGLQ5-2]MBS7583253.1 nuclear transport factor 2 family protein [Enterococcus sp. MMGLQ5-1]NPD11113.1 nuclear transport factor 2 family protein [Enterococcus sp. MMGLQ5-1]NPD35856.1 nuclear transport factor 2 family protein [Enterococcus sp. MMGLQ5-2]